MIGRRTSSEDCAEHCALQVEAACQVSWLSEVILDFLEVHGLKEAVGLVKASNKRCIVCTPRYDPAIWILSTWPLPP